MTRTTDIAGRLPNAVYTLPPHIVQAIVGLADVTDATREALVAECKKFYLAHRQYEESKEVFVDGEDEESTTITLDCGRLYAKGNNRQGQCGIGSEEDEVTGPRLIRLPPVLRVWCGHYRWFAETTRGLYAWGLNQRWFAWGMLGLGDERYVRKPRRVPIDSEVLDVCLTSWQSFFRTSSGWLGCGCNFSGQLGLGHTNKVNTPTPIPGSEGVTWWGGDHGITFGFCDNGLLACGENFGGQCGVGSTTEKITTLTPVALPDDVKGRVDRVICCSGSTFFTLGRRCFGCGRNDSGVLGIGSDESCIATPTELPVPVDEFILEVGVTVIRSGNTLHVCGDNEKKQIASNDTPKLTTPTPLDLPGPVVKVVISWHSVFVQLTDGSWVGRGDYENNDFLPLPGADLLDGHDNDRFLCGWTPVSDEVAGRLNFSVSNNNCMRIMILPEPIANV